VSVEIQEGVLSLCEVMWIVDLISETYKDTATGKLQIRRFSPRHYGLMTVFRKMPLNILQILYTTKH